jgi:thiamine-phosphate pyrophosphorylase
MLRQHSDVLRIIDANRNRSLEALRVLEDAARFVLDSEYMSRTAKELRHRLSAALAPLASQLPAARRIENDAGTQISTDSEKSRSGVAQVVRANASRLKESFRVLEEYSKILDPAMGEALQNIRYEFYSLERKLLSAFSLKERLQNALLMAIVLSTDPKGALDTARLAIEGGADIIQFREKDKTDSQILKTALELRNLTSEKDVLLIINDPTPTKSDAVVRGPEIYIEVSKAVTIPCFAVGGITPENITEAVNAGITRAAVASGISQASDPKQAAQKIKNAMLFD